MAEPPKRKTVASKDFVTVYANSFRMRLGDNDGSITFLAETDDQEGTLYNLEQVQVIMTPRAFKTLHMILTDFIAQLEKHFGPIVVAPNLQELLRAGMKVQTPDNK
jgi:hypothetical protein